MFLDLINTRYVPFHSIFVVSSFEITDQCGSKVGAYQLLWGSDCISRTAILILRGEFLMENNLTGTSRTTEGSRTEWDAGDNGGFSDGEVEARLENFASSDGLAEPVAEYTEKISDAMSQAKDYLGDKVSTIGEKIRGLATDDLSELADKAKDFARQKPGQAILVSAAAGVLLGLILRGRR
jgi:ElaB/YqjD/DUF883 family membrane-anchored ribosome-binding protein